MTVDLLCKVVDNYGDIGLVYRLARGLSELAPELKLRLVVDDLGAFHALAPGLDPCLEIQEYRGWTVATWTKGAKTFEDQRPRIVLECFACGRPGWFEDLLFDPADPEPRLVVNLEYLSAEDYAIDLHKMPSATRSELVKKVFFMPGFCQGTGGLVQDRAFVRARETFLEEPQRSEARARTLEALGIPRKPQGETEFLVLVFTYEVDYRGMVADLAAWAQDGHHGPLRILLAAGRSAKPFLAAYEAQGRPFALTALDFLAQEAWDEVLLACDLCIVRGEESLARASLSGRPFLWHAYFQEGDYQLVKVEALLELMRPYFAPQAFTAMEELYLDFNRRDRRTEAQAAELPARGPEPGRLAAFFAELPALQEGFLRFSRSVQDVGDLGANLLTFFSDLGYNA